MKKWEKLARLPKGERFQCPYCDKVVYSKELAKGPDGKRRTICTFNFCPECGKRVAASDVIVEVRW